MPTPQSSYVELAHQIHAGNQQAESELSRRIAPGITQVIVRSTGNFPLAEELCQETLIVILTRLREDPLTEPDKLPAFAAQVARNLIIAERRKERQAQD